MGTVTQIKNGQPATIPQQVYIKDLYTQLDVDYLKRQKPQTVGEADLLTRELQRQVWDDRIPFAKCEGCSECII